MNTERAFGRERWEATYSEGKLSSKAWYCPELDADFARTLERRGIRGGRALDLGAGPGTQAMELARLGFEVTASDISATAMELAAAEAVRQGVEIDWRQDDILNTGLAGPFDLILDRGCFHVIDPLKRATYVANVRRLLLPRGLLLLKCFSKYEQPDQGPHLLTEEQLRGYFERDFRVRSVRASRFRGAYRRRRKALYLVLERRRLTGVPFLSRFF